MTSCFVGQRGIYDSHLCLQLLHPRPPPLFEHVAVFVSYLFMLESAASHPNAKRCLLLVDEMWRLPGLPCAWNGKGQNHTEAREIA